jgi:hypothetical protein
VCKLKIFAKSFEESASALEPVFKGNPQNETSAVVALVSTALSGF